MTDELKAAAQTLRDLEDKLATAKAHLADTEKSIDGLAFDAHSGKNASAAKSLQALEATAATTARNVKTLETAITTARAKVAEAERAEADGLEVARAERALELLEQFEALANDLDLCLRSFIANYKSLESDWRALQALGYNPTGSLELAKINISLAASTVLQEVGLQERYLAPREKRSFGALIAGWAGSVRNRANARINRNKPSKAA